MTVGKFKNKTFCFSGQFNEFTRTDAVALVVARGGRCVSDVSNTIQYLVIGTSPGPVKLSMSTTSSQTLVSLLAFSMQLLTDSLILTPCPTDGGPDHVDNYLFALGGSFNMSVSARLDSFNCYMAGRLKAEAAVKVAQRVANNPNLHEHIPIRDTEKGTRTGARLSRSLSVL